MRQIVGKARQFPYPSGKGGGECCLISPAPFRPIGPYRAVIDLREFVIITWTITISVIDSTGTCDKLQPNFAESYAKQLITRFNICAIGNEFTKLASNFEICPISKVAANRTVLSAH